MYPMLALTLLTFAVRAAALAGGFVFDDALMFGHRTVVPLRELPLFFFSNHSQIFGSNFYRPVLCIWYELWFRLLGASPVGWHLLGIFLHLACVLLLYRLAMEMLESRTVAFVAAAIFAVHPAQVEAVAWTSAMGDPLMAAFLLLSMLAFLRWLSSGRAGYWIAALLAAEACFCCKETGVVLPVLLLAAAWTYGERAVAGRRYSFWLALIPFFALVLVHLALRRMVLPSFAHQFTPISDGSMILTWPSALLFYARHLFWPEAVVPFYPLGLRRAGGSFSCHWRFCCRCWRHSVLCWFAPRVRAGPPSAPSGCWRRWRRYCT